VSADRQASKQADNLCLQDSSLREREQTHADALEEEEDNASDSPDTHLVYELIKAIKVLKITWSVNEKSVYGKNETYIDIAIARHHQDGDVYFFLRQCIHLVDDDTGNKQTICCGVLIHKLNDMNGNTKKMHFYQQMYNFIYQIIWLKDSQV
jgi:hypothetical protein